MEDTGKIVRRMSSPDKELLALHNDKNFQSFLEQLLAIKVQAVFDVEDRRIDFMHALGEEVATSEFYKRYEHGKSQQFIMLCAAHIGLNWQRVYEAVAF